MQILKRLFAQYVVIGSTGKRYAFTWNGVLNQMRAFNDRKVEVYELIGGREAVVPFASRAIV